MCVSLTTWRYTTASILDLEEYWEGETYYIHNNVSSNYKVELLLLSLLLLTGM